MAKNKELPKLPYGEGSMRWANNSQTAVYYRKQISIDGKYHKLFVTASTPTEAIKLMRDEETRVRSQIETEEKKAKGILLRDAMRKWLELYKSQEVNDRTFDRIDSTFTTHIQNSSIGTMQEQAISADDIQEFINTLSKHTQKGEKIEDELLSYSSKKKVYELLNQYFNYRYITNPQKNPMKLVVKPKKSDEEVLEENEELVIWDDDEMDKITKVAMMEYRNGVEGYKNGSLISFLMWSFCRVGECQALQWKDFNEKTNTLTISKSYSRSKIRTGAKAGQYEYKIVPTKNKHKRSIKLCKNAVDALMHYKSIKQPKDDSEYICSSNGKIITVTSITNTYEAMQKYAELSTDKHVTLHGLRHSGISYFLRHGVPVEVVSKMAGHSSIDITQKVYYQILEEQKNRAIEDLDSFINKKK